MLSYIWLVASWDFPEFKINFSFFWKECVTSLINWLFPFRLLKWLTHLIEYQSYCLLRSSMPAPLHVLHSWSYTIRDVLAVRIPKKAFLPYCIQNLQLRILVNHDCSVSIIYHEQGKFRRWKICTQKFYEPVLLVIECSNFARKKLLVFIASCIYYSLWLKLVNGKYWLRSF